MKIAILGSRGIPANYGGFETFAEHLSVGLVEQGHTVTVYCPSYHEYKKSNYKGVRLTRILNIDNLFRYRGLRAAGNLAYDVMSLIHVSFSEAKIVYMLGYASGPAILIPRLFGKTVVVNPDGLEWKSKRWGLGARSWLYLCEWVAARCSSGLIADADAIQQHFKDRFDVDAASIPYGAEIPERSPPPPYPDDQPGYYLAVARMVPETSIPKMIRGFLLSGSDHKMTIIGPIPDAHFFESEIAPLVDGARVEYLGAIYDRDRLTRYREEAICLLHGHASDGTNPSLLESMGCSSPVIAVRTTSNAGVLGENDDFFFHDEEDLACCIRRLEGYESHELAALGARNRVTIEQRYSWAICVNRHVEAFARFAKRSKNSWGRRS